MAEKPRKELDALDLLMQDHREVESLFRDFEHLQKKGEATGAVIDNACAELRMLDTLENDVFYPAVSKAADEAEQIEALLDDAEDAHDTVLELIDELEELETDEERNAHFVLVIENVQRHILEEEAELFPKVQKLKLDLEALAAEMKVRRGELMIEMGLAEVDAEAA